MPGIYVMSIDFKQLSRGISLNEMKQILILLFQGILVHADNLPVPEARGTRQVFTINKQTYI